MRYLFINRYIAVALLCSCATGPDTRPETADYIIEAILVPYCGRAGCHSTETAEHGLVFATIDGSLAAMATNQRGEKMVVPGEPLQSRLVEVLSDGSRIMPPDVPLPDADIALISQWITDGAVGFQ